jgi:hypothetical protein
MSIYNVDTQGQVFRDARLDLVESLTTFQETLINADVTPNITGVHDSHTVAGLPAPYATVGIVRADFQNVGAGNTTYDMVVKMQAQIFIHFAPMGEIYDERFRWDLLNSLFNYYKNTQRVSSNFDGLFISSMEADVQFPTTQTSGAVFNVELWKVVST